MTKYSDGYNHIVEINGDTYLVQGKAEDPILMHRQIDDLLECEKDSVQVMLGESI